MALLKLILNRATGQLVTSQEQPTPFNLPAFVQGDTLAIEFSIVEPAPSLGVGKVAYVSLAPYSLKIGVGGQPLGNGSVTPAALQTSWTLSADNYTYSGSLALNTTEINTLIGSAHSVAAWFEIEVRVVATGGYETVFGKLTSLRAQLIAAGSSTPVSPDSPALSVAEAFATYVPRVGQAGGSIILISSDGAYAVQLYCHTDGSFQATPIPVP